MENEAIKLEEVPSIFHPDEEEYEVISDWATSIHDEGKCEEAIDVLCETEEGGYRATAHHLLGHMIDEHNFTLEEIAPVLESYQYYYTDQQRLADVYENESARLTSELKHKWENLPKSPGMKRGLRLLIFHGLNEVQLKDLWSYTWEDGRYKIRKDVAELLFRQAASKEDFFDLIKGVLKDKLDWLADEKLKCVIQELLSSEALASIREEYLEKLINDKGAEAAQIIVRYADYSESSIPRMTKKIYQLLEDEEEKFASKAMALWLRNNFKEALPHLCDLINKKHPNASFSYELQQAVNATKPHEAFKQLAEDVATTDGTHQPFLAKSHSRLFDDVEEVVHSWSKSNWDREELQKYTSGLCVEILSEPGLNEKKKKFMEIAEHIFERFSSRPREEVLEENNLKGEKGEEKERQKALALVKEIKESSYDLDKENFLETIQDYPSTFKAFGGETLVDFVKRRDGVPCYAWVYEIDIENRKSELKKQLAEDKDRESISLSLRLEWKRIREAEQFRKIWEERFDVLLNSESPIKGSRVREDLTYWTELRFWAQLEDDFDVTVEPENIPGLEDKKPDFLLTSPEGHLILEVTSFEKSPEDLEERVKISKGLRPQKRLESKWEGQFKECKEDPGLPIVIGLEVRSKSQLKIDLPNSLYGPLSFRGTTDKSEGPIEEGTTRDLERAFFARKNLECISAVVGIDPEFISQEKLNGEIFRPISQPCNKINWRLWRRLRDALFGSEEQHLIDRMMKIPTITSEEAESLVEHGIDHPGYLASERVTFPGGLQMSYERFKELQEWAVNLIRYKRSNHVSTLDSVDEEITEKLADEEIKTVEEVVEVEQKPESIEERIWKELRKEAWDLLSRVEDV